MGEGTHDRAWGRGTRGPGKPGKDMKEAGEPAGGEDTCAKALSSHPPPRAVRPQGPGLWPAGLLCGCPGLSPKYMELSRPGKGLCLPIYKNQRGAPPARTPEEQVGGAESS